MKSSEEKLGPSRAEVFEVEREEGCPPLLLNAARFMCTGRVQKSLYGSEVESLSGAEDQLDVAHR